MATFGAASAVTTASSVASIAVPVVTGADVGKLIVVEVYVERTDGITAPDATWFQEAAVVNNSSGSVHQLRRFYHRPSGPESGTYTFTFDGSAPFASGYSVRIDDPPLNGNPFDQGAGATVTGASSGNQSSTPSLSLTTQAGDRLVLYSAASFGATNFGAAGSLTERVDDGNMLMATGAQPAAGGTGSLSSNITTAASSAILGVIASPVRGVSSAAVDLGSGGVVVAKPAGTVDGDVMYAFHFAYSTDGGMTASGWTVEAGHVLNAGNNYRHKVWKKVASSEGATYTFNQSISDAGIVIIVAVNGASATGEVVSYDLVAAGDATADAPSVTPGSASSLLLCAYGWSTTASGAASITPPTGMTEEADVQIPTPYDLAGVASLVLSSAAATGVKTATTTKAGAAIAAWAASTVAVPMASTAPADTVLNPVSDASNAGAWTRFDGGSTSLFGEIDESTRDDVDGIMGPLAAAGVSSVYEVQLQAGTDPVSSVGHVLRYSYRKSLNADVVDLAVELRQGTTVIASWSHTGIGTSYTLAEQTLTGTQADAITDYADLRVRFTQTVQTNATTPTKVADRSSLNGNTAAATFDHVLTGLTVGNFLVIRTAADNTGGGGSARSLTVTNQSGTAMGTILSQLQQNNDPGASGDGTTANLVIVPITATSGTIRLSYSGNVVQASVVEEWSGLDSVVGTPVQANGVNSTNMASLTDSSVAAGNLAYAVQAIEGPSSDTYNNDADTDGGVAWTPLTKVGTTNATAITNQTVYGAYKIPTTTVALTYNPTITTNARDSAGIIAEIARGPATARAQVSWVQFELPGGAVATVPRRPVLVGQAVKRSRYW